MQVALEANRAGTGAPLSRQARVQRTQGDLKLLLCCEHQQLRMATEPIGA